MTAATGVLRLRLPDAAATETLGAALAASTPRPASAHLHGDLGAGKSTLARAWLRALGVPGAIRSPTYTLIERYELADGGVALHLDLYRIADAGELEFLGLDEVDVGLWLVEWPERGGTGLAPADLRVSLGFERDGRAAELVAASPAGEAWLGRLVQVSELRHLLSLP